MGDFLTDKNTTPTKVAVTAQPKPQPNSTLTQVGVDKVISWTTTPPHHPSSTFKALPDNIGSWFSVCNLILTQLDEIWKTTLIFLKMEDDLNCFTMEDNLKSFQMTDDINFVLGNLGSWF